MEPVEEKPDKEEEEKGEERERGGVSRIRGAPATPSLKWVRTSSWL